MKAYIFQCVNAVGDIQRHVYTYDDYYDPLIIQVAGQIFVIQDNKIKMQLVGVDNYRMVEDYETPDAASPEPQTS